VWREKQSLFLPARNWWIWWLNRNSTISKFKADNCSWNAAC